MRSDETEMYDDVIQLSVLTANKPTNLKAVQGPIAVVLLSVTARLISHLNNLNIILQLYN